MEKNQNIKWCPKPACETPIERKHNQDMLVCPTCSSHICFHCGNYYHQGTSCSDVMDENYKRAMKE